MTEELYDLIKQNKEVFDLFVNSKNGFTVLKLAKETQSISNNTFWQALNYDENKSLPNFFDIFYDPKDIETFKEFLQNLYPNSSNRIEVSLKDNSNLRVIDECTIFHFFDKNLNSKSYFLFHNFQFPDFIDTNLDNPLLKYRVYFEESPFVMLLFRLEDGIILEANPKFKEKCGLSIEDYKDLSIWDIIKFDSVEDKDVLINKVKKKLRFGPLDIQFVCYGKGGYMPAFLDGFAYTGANGEILIWATVRDQSRLRLTENELKVNTEQLKSIVSIFPDLVLFFDADGIIQNYYAKEIKDYFLSDFHLKSNKIDNILGQELGNRFLKSIQSAINHNNTEYFEYSISGNEGINWFEARFMIGTNGNVICIVRNISSQKAAEINLQEERQLLRTIIDHIPMNIYVKDLEMNKIMANKAEYEFLGAQSETEVLGQSESQFYPPNTVNNSYLEDKFVLESSQSILGKESKSVKKDGEENWIITNKIPLTDRDGQLKGIVGISYDITEKRKSENDLRLVQEQYQLAIAGSNDGIWDWNIAENKIFLSERWKEQLGYNADELEGNLERLCELIHPEDLYLIKSTFKEYQDKNVDHFRVELRIQHKDGTYRNILSRARGVWSETGELVRLAGSHTDITERIRSQRELKKAKNFLAQTSNIAKVGGWESDFEAEQVEWTEMTKIILGLPVNYEPQFEDKLRFFKEGHFRDLVSENLVKTIKTGESFDIETKLVSPLEGEKWVRLIGMRDFSTEASNKLVGTIQDITEIKKLEEAVKSKNAELEASYRRISEITDSISDVLWSYRIDNKGQLIKESITRQADELLGLPQGTIGDSFEKFFSYIHPEDHVYVMNQFQILFLAEKPNYEVEYRMTLPDGSIKWVNTNAKAYKNENEVYAVGRTTDINLRKENEKLIERQSELLKLLVSITSEFINIPLNDVAPAINESLHKLGQFIQSDSAFIYIYPNYNLPPEKLYDWQKSDYPITQFDLEDIILDLDPLWSENLNSGNYFNTNNVYSNSETMNKYLEKYSLQTIISFPLMDRLECTGFVGFMFYLDKHTFTDFELQLLKVFAEILVNIRKRSLLQEHLIEAKVEAETANKAKTEFLANMGHEIRTPLNGVIGFTDLLMNSKLNYEQLQYAGSAHTSAHSLLGLINDILDFTKIEAGKMNLEEIKTDIIELMEQTADIVKYSSAKKGVEFLLNISLNVPRFVFVDSYRLKQILINLLSNAIKFTNVGEVELKVEFKVTSKPNIGEFYFAVRDTGIGISKEQQRHLFKSFSQADASTTRKFGGTGLGLVIAEMLANKMDSSIILESEIHQGSTFSFSIKKEFLEGHRVENIGIELIKHVLVVDDNHNNIKILERILKHWGINTIAVMSGSEALEKIRLHSDFNLIIVDFHMPEMDGLETIDRIQKYYTEKGVERPKIILYSSADDSLINYSVKDLTIDFKLIKPAKITELLYALNSLYHREDVRNGSIQMKKNTLHEIFEFDSQKKILIAEDVPLNLLLVKTYLNNNFSNFEVFEAANGELAVSQYQEVLPDLVLMDVQMPKMDGYEATRQIRKHEKEINRQVPIIALTAGAILEEKERCLSAGMDDFLTKPINKDELIETIRLHLSKKND